ncbi:hypothetical protein HDV01_005021 [Terramyces sp. JEL0728]|nr:hypothetical protein HDV01_005021 [Terramyces sp. JEL0728]
MRVEFVIENFMPVKSANILQEEEEKVEEVTKELIKNQEEEEQPTEEEEPAEVEKTEEPIPAQEVLQEVEEQVEPPPLLSPKHEAAINELKSYITSVLVTKLDEIKTTVSQKIAAQEEAANAKTKEDDKKKPIGKPKK